jgi:hypothetical protein
MNDNLDTILKSIRAQTTQQPDIVWEYCQLADVPKPGSLEAQKALLYFPSGDSTVEIPPENVLDVIAELGAQGWEMIQIIVVKNVQWPSTDTRSSLSYMIEGLLKQAPKGAAYAYESLGIGLLYFFKRPKQVS